MFFVLSNLIESNKLGCSEINLSPKYKFPKLTKELKNSGCYKLSGCSSLFLKSSSLSFFNFWNEFGFIIGVKLLPNSQKHFGNWEN